MGIIQHITLLFDKKAVTITIEDHENGVFGASFEGREGIFTSAEEGERRFIKNEEVFVDSDAQKLLRECVGRLVKANGQYVSAHSHSPTIVDLEQLKGILGLDEISHA
ncbi:hypothetical protein LOH54_01155 [Sulfurimonas sp. HSL-3221]|uniref:hypothetical protein n=1 Tax=Sulfurimonadaceae TaxID=2771471 RepID=UPI001E621EE4|nr:hypothetical protein [Sulfurimonas sp. HSL-3221]UFS62749.1 hypothetical protein LOH54_01155 [Sulfurimonas sp. HSL-3221]